MRPEDFDDGGPPLPGVELKGGPDAWREYAGKMVAVANGEVRASGTTWAECMAAVKRAGLGLDSVEFMFVPGGAFIG